jgi:hypothetical protein
MVCISVPKSASEDIGSGFTQRRPKATLFKNGAGNETRTRDPDLGKVVLYQLSYSRIGVP